MRTALTALLLLATAAPGYGGEAERRRAVDRGLAALAATWAEAERSHGPAVNGPPKLEPKLNRTAAVAAASFGGLAFLQSGSLPGPGGGPHSRQLDYCLAVVFAAQQDDGLIGYGRGPREGFGDPPPGEPPDDGSGRFVMYAQGFATLFLAEAILRSEDADLRQRLAWAVQKAVRLSERCQNDEGGWRYFLKPRDADSSVTACQLNALLAARAAGADVSADALRRARAYLARCRNDDGGYAYMAAAKGASELPRSAAAVAALWNAGDAAAALEPALRYLASAAPPAPGRWKVSHQAYAHYYLAQALATPGGAGGGAGGPYAAACDAYEAALLARQAADGHWDFAPGPGPGRAGGTAMALVALQTRDRPLRAFRRAGP